MTELTDSSALAAVENFITDAGRMLLKIGATLLLTYVLALLSTLTVWRLTTRRSAAAATSKADVEAEAPIEAEVPTKAEVPTEAGGRLRSARYRTPAVSPDLARRRAPTSRVPTIARAAQSRLGLRYRPVCHCPRACGRSTSR